MTSATESDPKDAAQAALAKAGIRAGDLYRHYKGGLYEVVTPAVLEATCEPAVVYRSLLKGYVWVRTLANFTELVTVEGRRVPRFAKEES